MKIMGLVMSILMLPCVSAGSVSFVIEHESEMENEIGSLDCNSTIIVSEFMEGNEITFYFDDTLVGESCLFEYPDPDQIIENVTHGINYTIEIINHIIKIRYNTSHDSGFQYFLVHVPLHSNNVFDLEVNDTTHYNGSEYETTYIVRESQSPFRFFANVTGYLFGTPSMPLQNLYSFSGHSLSVYGMIDYRGGTTYNGASSREFCNLQNGPLIPNIITCNEQIEVLINGTKEQEMELHMDMQMSLHAAYSVGSTSSEQVTLRDPLLPPNHTWNNVTLVWVA